MKWICLILVGVAAVSGSAGPAPNLRNTLISAAIEAGWESMDISENSGDDYSGVTLESDTGLISIVRYPSPADAAAGLDKAGGAPSTFERHPSKDVQLGNVSYSITWQSGAYVYSVASAEDVERVASVFYRELKKAGIMEPPAPAGASADLKPTPPASMVPSGIAVISGITIEGRRISAHVACRNRPPGQLLIAHIQALDSGRILQVVPILLPADGTASLHFVRPFDDWPGGDYKASVLWEEKEIGSRRFFIPRARRGP